MDLDDLPQFAALLVITGELYSKSIPDYLTDLYWEALQKFDLAKIKQAFKLHINNPNGGQFFPKPADLIKIMSKSQASKIAWIKVEYAIKKAGIYRSVEFDDPLIHATIAALGGWIKICSTLLKDWSWLVAEFQRQYEKLEFYPSVIAPKHCHGLIEMMNNHSGYQSENPILVNNLSINLVNHSLLTKT